MTMDPKCLEEARNEEAWNVVESLKLPLKLEAWKQPIAYAIAKALRSHDSLHLAQVREIENVAKYYQCEVVGFSGEMLNCGHQICSTGRAVIETVLAACRERQEGGKGDV